MLLYRATYRALCLHAVTGFQIYFFVAVLFETVGKRKNNKVYLYNSYTNSYLKIEENDGSYTVWIAPAGKDKKKMA